jgi:hypothetical protein
MLPRKTCAHVTRAMLRVWLICMWWEPVCELTVRARGGETRRCDTKIPGRVGGETLAAALRSCRCGGLVCNSFVTAAAL